MANEQSHPSPALAGSDDDPRHGGLELSVYVAVEAALAEGFAQEEVLSHEGLTEAEWQRAVAGWGDAITQSVMGDLRLFDRHDAALGEARARHRRPIPPLDEDLELWTSFSRTWMTQEDPTRWLSERELTMGDLLGLQQKWSQAFIADPKLLSRQAELLEAEPQAIPELTLPPRHLPPPVRAGGGPRPEEQAPAASDDLAPSSGLNDPGPDATAAAPPKPKKKSPVFVELPEAPLPAAAARYSPGANPGAEAPEFAPFAEGLPLPELPAVAPTAAAPPSAAVAMSPPNTPPPPAFVIPPAPVGAPAAAGAPQPGAGGTAGQAPPPPAAPAPAAAPPAAAPPAVAHAPGVAPPAAAWPAAPPIAVPPIAAPPVAAPPIARPPIAAPPVAAPPIAAPPIAAPPIAAPPAAPAAAPSPPAVAHAPPPAPRSPAATQIASFDVRAAASQTTGDPWAQFKVAAPPNAGAATPNAATAPPAPPAALAPGYGVVPPPPQVLSPQPATGTPGGAQPIPPPPIPAGATPARAPLGGQPQQALGQSLAALPWETPAPPPAMPQPMAPRTGGQPGMRYGSQSLPPQVASPAGARPGGQLPSAPFSPGGQSPLQPAMPLPPAGAPGATPAGPGAAAFQPGPGGQAAPPPAGTSPAQAPFVGPGAAASAGQHAGAGGAAPGFLGGASWAGPLPPVQMPVALARCLTIDDYASTRAELEVFPEQRERVLGKYGLSGEAWQQEERAWQAEFDSQPHAAQDFEQRLDRYRAHWRGVAGWQPR